jgi:hypothetical protein
MSTSTQQCPQCKKIVSLEDSFCRACGAKLTGQSAEPQPVEDNAPQPQQPVQKSAGSSATPASAATPAVGGLVWRQHVDAWNGFSLERPSGWEVRATQDTITVCQDLQGLVSIMIRPIQFQQHATADELALRMVEMMRASSSNFSAWQMAPQDKTYIAMHRGPDQVLLRVRFTEENQELAGVLSVMVDGNTALVSGFQAPIPMIEKMKPVFQHILASFSSIPRLPRTQFVEPGEQAFAAMIPEQWTATGKVMRTPDAGIVFQFRATDPGGTLSAEVPGRYYFFQEEAKGWLGKIVVPQKYPTRPHVPATMFLEQIMMPELRQRYADLRVERIVNRADLAASLVTNAFQMGEWVHPKELTAAALQCTFTENGVQYRQRTYIAVQKWPMTRVWRATVGSVIRTPHDQFIQNYATLEGITESVRPEMQWVQVQRQRAQQARQQSFQQIAGAISAMQGAQGQHMQPHQQMPVQQPWLPGAGMSMNPGMPQGGPQGQAQGMSVQEQMAMQQAWQQAQIKQLEIMRNSNQQIFNMQQAGMQHRIAAQEQQFQSFDQVIRGYQSMHNPYSGAQYEVPIGYNNYWGNGLDQVAGSNWSDAPGAGFQRLDSM